MRYGALPKKYKQPPQDGDTPEQLRELDKSVTKPNAVILMIIGVISSLILGIGMCCTMMWNDTIFISQILIGIVGIFGTIIAYPLYTSITKRWREKLAPEIIRLSGKLIKWYSCKLRIIKQTRCNTLGIAAGLFCAYPAVCL